MNIYAPTGPEGSAPRKELWKELFAELDNIHPSVFVGDFNMVEDLEDHAGGSPHVITGREKRAWDHFKQKFGIKDTFKRVPGRLRFTWDNRRSSTSQGPRCTKGLIEDTHKESP